MSSNIFKSIIERAECYISICIVGNGLNRLSVLILQHEVKGISFKSFVLQSLTCLQCQRSLCVVGIVEYKLLTILSKSCTHYSSCLVIAYNYFHSKDTVIVSYTIYSIVILSGCSLRDHLVYGVLIGLLGFIASVRFFQVGQFIIQLIIKADASV